MSFHFSVLSNTPFTLSTSWATSSPFQVQVSHTMAPPPLIPNLPPPQIQLPVPLHSNPNMSSSSFQSPPNSSSFGYGNLPLNQQLSYNQPHPQQFASTAGFNQPVRICPYPRPHSHITPAFNNNQNNTINHMSQINEQYPATSRMPLLYTNVTPSSTGNSENYNFPSISLSVQSPMQSNPTSVSISHRHSQNGQIYVSTSSDRTVEGSGFAIPHHHHHHHHHHYHHDGSQYYVPHQTINFQSLTHSGNVAYAAEPISPEEEHNPFAASEAAIVSLISQTVADKLKIASSQTSTSSKENEIEIPTCAICLTDFILEDFATFMPCDHPFHKECLLPWLRKQNSCPTCRYEIETNDAEYNRVILRKRAQSIRKERRRRARQQANAQSSASTTNSSHSSSANHSTEVVDLTQQTEEADVVDLTEMISDSDDDIEIDDEDDNDIDEYDDVEEDEDDHESEFAYDDEFELEVEDDHKEDMIEENSASEYPNLFTLPDVSYLVGRLYNNPLSNFHPAFLPSDAGPSLPTMPRFPMTENQQFGTLPSLIVPLPDVASAEMPSIHCCFCGFDVPQYSFMCGHAFHTDCWHNYMRSRSSYQCPRCNVTNS